MSTKYPNIGKPNIKAPTMRKWFASILEQTGGMTRYVDMLNEKGKNGKHTSEANELYCQMLDKCVRLEPKEQVLDSTITIQLDMPQAQPVLPQPIEVIDVKTVDSKD